MTEPAPWTPSNEDNPRTLWDNARAARRAGERLRALEGFRAAARLRPGDAQLQQDLASAAWDLGRFDEASDAYREALTLDPAHVDALRGLGHLARRLGNRQAALVHFTAACTANPTQPKHHQEVGEELRALNRLDEAAQAFERATRLEPRFEPALRGLAEVARRQGNDALLLDCLTALDTLEPGSPPREQAIADTLFRLGRLDEAGEAYQGIFERDAGSFDALRGFGLVSRRRGDHTAALMHFERAATLREDSRLAVEMARARIALGATEESAFEALLANDSTKHRTCLDLSRSAQAKGDPAGALSWLDKAAAANPDDRETRLALAESYRSRWDIDRAEKLFDAHLRECPGDTCALLGKANLARMRGARPDARRLFEAAYASDPIGAAVEFARDLREAGEFGAADEVLVNLAAARPDDPSVLVQRGVVARASGDLAAALDHFDEAIRRFPAHVSAHVEKATVLQRLGRIAELRTLLARATALWPDHPRVLETAGALALAADAGQDALTLYRRAADAVPMAIAPRLKVAQCEAALGLVENALVTIDTASAMFGPQPDAILLKAQILKQQGRMAEAAEAFHAGASAYPFSFQLWLQRALFLIDTNVARETSSDLDAAPVSTAAEKTKTAIVAGAQAAARWDHAGAQTHYRSALPGNETDGALHARIATTALLTLDLAGTEHHLRSLAGLETTTRRLRGQSLGPMQTLVGQILDEARLDGIGLDRLLAAAKATGWDARLVAILGCVRDMTGMTLAAIQAMIAMRRCGWLDGDRSRHAPSAIPAEIVQFWHSAEMPADVLEISRSWRALNPGFRYRRWSEREAYTLLSVEYPPAVADAFRRARDPARKADLFRLAYLLRFGGLYADADDRCVAPLDGLLRNGSALLVYQEDIGSIGNNIIGATPNHPIISRALDLAVESVANGDNDIPWLATGPGLLTRVLAHTIAEGGVSRLQDLGIEILERRALLRFVATCCMTAYKHTPRHWSRAAFLAQGAPIGRRSTEPTNPEEDTRRKQTQ